MEPDRLPREILESGVPAVDVLTELVQKAARPSQVFRKTRSLSADGKTAVCEMDNHLIIMGDTLEHFPETEVVEFDNKGLIVQYRLHCDPKPITDIAVRKLYA